MAQQTEKRKPDYKQEIGELIYGKLKPGARTTIEPNPGKLDDAVLRLAEIADQQDETISRQNAAIEKQAAEIAELKKVVGELSLRALGKNLVGSPEHGNRPNARYP
jgi:hypothetical protein